MKRPCLLLFLSVIFGVAAPAQTAQQPPPMPADPAALLELASRLDGLHPSNLSPWHVRATFAIAYNKKQVNQGAWEEWWVSPKQYKIHFAVAGFDQTRYFTDRGWFATGSHDAAPDSFYELSNTILGPLADPSALSQATLLRRTVKQGNVTLDCIDRDRGAGPGFDFAGEIPLVREYCFIGDLPAIRLADVSGAQMVLNSIVQFQGQYLPEQIDIDTIDGNHLSARVQSIETIKPQNADFQPPPDATPLTPVVQLAGDVAEARRIAGAQPEYPEQAKASRVQGSVILEVDIGRDGTVENVKVLKGDLLLQRAAVDAVRTWRFRPWLVDGQPVGFRTYVNLAFGLSAGRGALW